MPRVQDELHGLRAVLQERVTGDFDDVMTRRRSRRRRHLIGGCAAGAVVVAGVAAGLTLAEPGDTAAVKIAPVTRGTPSAARLEPPCRQAFSLSLVSDRGGQPTPVAAAYWFVAHGRVGPLPTTGWRVIKQEGGSATLASGRSRLHTLQGPDETWQVDAGSVCP